MMTERIGEGLPGPTEEAVLQRPEGQHPLRNLMRNQRVPTRPNVLVTRSRRSAASWSSGRINAVTLTHARGFLQGAAINLVNTAARNWFGDEWVDRLRHCNRTRRLFEAQLRMLRLAAKKAAQVELGRPDYAILPASHAQRIPV